MNNQAVSRARPPARRGIEAEINFIVPDGRKVSLFQFDPPPGRPKLSHAFVGRRVFIANGRPLADRFSLDQQGFALVPHETAVTDLYDEAALRDVYYPEMERLLKAKTGAAKALIFNHAIRTSQKSPDAAATRDPVLRAHNDFTLQSGPDRLRAVLPGEAEERLKRRFAIVNVWRPIVGPLQEFPLALADAASVVPRDLIVSELIYPDHVVEVYTVAHNSGQRWFTFPEMRRDEVVLIRTYDSSRGDFSAHSAFADPNVPNPALHRESIEIRALLLWD